MIKQHDHMTSNFQAQYYNSVPVNLVDDKHAIQRIHQQ